MAKLRNPFRGRTMQLAWNLNVKHFLCGSTHTAGGSFVIDAHCFPGKSGASPAELHKQGLDEGRQQVYTATRKAIDSDTAVIEWRRVTAKLVDAQTQLEKVEARIADLEAKRDEADGLSPEEMDATIKDLIHSREVKTGWTATVNKLSHQQGTLRTEAEKAAKEHSKDAVREFKARIAAELEAARLKLNDAVGPLLDEYRELVSRANATERLDPNSLDSSTMYRGYENHALQMLHS